MNNLHCYSLKYQHSQMVFIPHIDVFDGLTRVIIFILCELKMYADKKRMYDY